MTWLLLDPEPVQKWLDEHHSGDELIASTRVMTPTNYQVTAVGSSRGNPASIEATGQRFGLDPEKRSWLLGGRAGVLALTATRFYILRLGGLREKIKETVFEARRDEVRFAAHDLTSNRLVWRHWLVTGLAENKYLLEPQVLGKVGKPSKIAPGSTAFLAELGGQVQYVSNEPPGN